MRSAEFLFHPVKGKYLIHYGFETNDTDPLSYFGINIGLVWTK